MTKTQEKLYELFCEIDKICKENDIEYYIAGGTLIGAMRHKGFIPWDDDLDIMMTRKNYQKFIDYCRDNLPADRVFECQELNRGYHNMFGRYTDLSTCALHQSQMYHSDSAGYVIDILPLDAMPDKGETYEQYVKDLMLYSDLLNPYPIYSFRWNFNHGRYFRYRLKALFLGKKKVLKQLEDRMFCHDEDECDYLVMRWGGIPFIFDKSMYMGKRYEKLLDTDAQVPFRTSDYLVWHYGDNWYMLPPNQEQQTHEAIFSLTTKQHELRQVVNKAIKPKFERVFLEIRKVMYFITMKSLRGTKAIRRKLKAAAFSKDFSIKFNAQREEIFKLLENNDFEALSAIYSDYFAMQLDRLYIGREDFAGAGEFHSPVLMEIDEDLFEIAIKTLINTDKMASALRLMDVYEQNGKTISPSLTEIRKTLGAYRTLVSKLDTNEPIQNKSAIKGVIESFPKCPSFIIFALTLYKDNADAYAQILEYAKNTIPQSLELQEILLSKKQAPITDKLYEYLEIYENSQNGLLRLKIADILENECENILAHFENSDSETTKKVLEAAYKIASLLPHIRKYITFYMQKAPAVLCDVVSYRKFYLSAIRYYKKNMENDSDAQFFRQLFIDTFQKIYGTKEVAECLFLIATGDQTVSKTELAQTLENLEKSDVTDLLLALTYSKLGKKRTALSIYKNLWTNIKEPRTLALLSVATLSALGEFYNDLLVLMDPDDFAAQHKKVFGKVLPEEKSELERERYTKIFFDTITPLFGTPKALADLLKILNIELIDFYYPTEDQVWSPRLFQIMYESMAFEKPVEKERNTITRDDSLAFKLLCEIDDICKRENIEYCLYDKAATNITKEPLPSSKIKILMNVDEFDKFVKIMETQKAPNRSFDSLYSNPNYHYFSAKYSSTDSARINPHDIKNKIDKGVCVEILPVRAEKSPRIRKIYRLQEQGWESAHYKAREIFSSIVFFVTFIYNFIVTRFVSKKRYSRYIYNMLVKNYKEIDKQITKKYSINEFGKFLSMFDQNPLEFLKPVEYCSRTFFVPQNLEIFMKKTKPSKAFDSYHNENAEGAIICCQNLSNKEFFEQNKEDIVKLNKMINSQTQLRRICSSLTRRRTRNWVQANAAADKLFTMSTQATRLENRQILIDNLLEEDCALTLLKMGVPYNK